MSALHHIVYLHGFRSSPRSAKALAMAQWAASQPGLQWCCPQLPPSPAEAMALLRRLTADWPDEGVALLGSSLGGYYASHLACQRPRWRVALMNPAVDPARDLAAHIGEQSAFHTPEERFFFRPEFIGELRALAVPLLPRPERAMAIVATGDEVLDWREMQAAWAGSALRLVTGSDHALSDFDDHLPALLQFLKLCD